MDLFTIGVVATGLVAMDLIEMDILPSPPPLVRRQTPVGSQPRVARSRAMLIMRSGWTVPIALATTVIAAAILFFAFDQAVDDHAIAAMLTLMSALSLFTVTLPRRR